MVAGPGDIFEFDDTVLSVSERRKVYAWHNAKSRGVEMVGEFIAFRIPAYGQLHVDDALIDCWSNIRQLSIMESGEIVLNGRATLQDWLGSRVRAPEGHYATLTDANRDAAEKTHVAEHAAPLQQDEVQTVEFKGAEQWTISIGGIDRAPTDPWK